MDSLRCSKLLWCEYNNKSIFPAEDESSKDVIEQGMLVESFARKLFHGGITIEREHSPVRQLQNTRDAMKSRKPLFGAGFQYKELYALADQFQLNVPAGGAERRDRLDEVVQSLAVAEVSHIQDADGPALAAVAPEVEVRLDQA